MHVCAYVCLYVCTYAPYLRICVGVPLGDPLSAYVHMYVHTSLVSHAGEPPPSASHLPGGRDGRSLAPQHIGPSGRHGCAV